MCVCGFGLRIKATVHRAVDGMFSLCFAAGFRGRSGMINQPLAHELMHRWAQSRTVAMPVNHAVSSCLVHGVDLLWLSAFVINRDFISDGGSQHWKINLFIFF